MAGGRPKGSRNKTPAFQRKIGEGGITPLEYLLEVVRDVTQDRAERIKAAQAAAPYVHPRLAITEQIIRQDRLVAEMSEAELVAVIADEEGSGEGVAEKAASAAEPSSLH